MNYVKWVKCNFIKTYSNACTISCSVSGAQFPADCNKKRQIIEIKTKQENTPTTTLQALLTGFYNSKQKSELCFTCFSIFFYSMNKASQSGVMFKTVWHKHFFSRCKLIKEANFQASDCFCCRPLFQESRNFQTFKRKVIYRQIEMYGIFCCAHSLTKLTQRPLEFGCVIIRRFLRLRRNTHS